MLPVRLTLISLLLLGAAPVVRPAAGPVLARYDLARPSRVVRLPPELVEVSGLAALPDGQLLAHNDESPTIYVVDPLTGMVSRTIQLVGRARRGDFEEILLIADTVYLVESDGTIYHIVLPAPGAKARYRRTQGLLGGQCEVEAMAQDIGRPGLIALCKRIRGLRDHGAMLGYRWSFRNQGYERHPSMRIPWEEFGPKEAETHFAASGMTRTPEGRSWIVLDGPNQRIAEIDSAGRVLSVAHLPEAILPQAEGVTIGHDGTLYVASEGHRGPATLALYYPNSTP